MFVVFLQPYARRDRASFAVAGKGLPVKAGNDGGAEPAMTVFVMPDVFGHLLLPQRRDCRSRPAMTGGRAGNDGRGRGRQ